MVRAPRKIAAIAATIHGLVVAAFAIWIYTESFHDGESPMDWIYLLLLDLPVSLLFKPLAFVVDGLDRVSWVPGLAGDWPNFLYPLVFFAIVGTLWWYFVGWVCGRVIRAIPHNLLRKPLFWLSLASLAAIFALLVLQKTTFVRGLPFSAYAQVFAVLFVAVIIVLLVLFVVGISIWRRLHTLPHDNI